MMKRVLCFLLLAAVLFTCFAQAETPATLKVGDSGQAVLELTARLRQLNYSTVPAGEKFTETTKEAVSAVQRAYGLPVTGEADAATQAVLYGNCYRPLESGASGEDVKAVQEKLTEMGYYSGKITGNYLEGTAAAIKTMQQENGLEPTGKADVKTLETLFSLSVRPTPTPTPVPTPRPTLGPKQPFTKKLSYGDQSEDVRKVQQRLMDLGFFTYHKTTTGFYAQTQDAVKKFQKQNGLDVTGVVNEKTWDALFNDPEVADANSEPKPAPAPSYFLEVDVNNQVVKVWKLNPETGEYSDLDRAFLCATGTKSNPSPLGTFTLSGRRARWCEFPKWGGGKAQYWTKINDDIAFHSVLYADNNDMSLKVNSLTGLGKRGSHGCIRLTVADAKWIYDHVEKGMQVLIHEDAAADPELRYAVQPGELDRTKMMPRTTPEPPVYPEYDGAEVPEGEVRSLSVGKEGADVYWLQMKLKELGFYSGTVTGQYREGTKKAVQAYQKSRGLKANGTANTATLNKLYEEVAEANATPTPIPTPEPLPAPTPAPQA